MLGEQRILKIVSKPSSTGITEDATSLPTIVDTLAKLNGEKQKSKNTHCNKFRSEVFKRDESICNY